MATKVKSKSELGKNYEKAMKYFRLVLLAAVLIVVFYPPYLRGLFFEVDQLPTEIFVFLVFAAFWVFKALKKDRKFLVTPIDYASLGFVVVYLLSIFASVSLRLAISEWLKYCMYFAVFFMVTELAEDFKSRITILWVIAASGTGVALLGLDAAAGGHIAGVFNQLFKVLGADHDVFFELFKDGRIFSVLQYPNALAAYLMGVYFITLGLIMVSERIWVRALAGAISFVFLITFVFTLSRGGYMVMLAAAVIYLIVLPKGSRTKGVAFAFASIVSTGIVSIKYAGYISNSAGSEFKMWLSIAAGIVLSAVLVVLIKYIVKYIELLSWKVYAGIIVFLIVASIAVSAYLYSVPASLELSHTDGEADSYKASTKSFELQPGTEYALEYEVESDVSGDKPYAYSIEVYSRDLKDILNEVSGTKLTGYSGTNTGLVQPSELEFSVPSESRVIDVVFSNYYEGTSAKFTNAKVVGKTGDFEEQIVLKRKYIPESISGRLENYTTAKSYIERFVFYKDGLNMILDRWFLGAGGGAWSLSYFSYQSYMYWSNQAHNFPLQLGVETGLLGIIILIFLLVSILSIFIIERKSRKDDKEDSLNSIIQSVLLAGIAAVFMHSVLDFDLTYGSVFLLLWQLIALLNSFYRQRVLSNNYKSVNSGIFNWLKKVNLHPVLGAVISLALIILPVMFISGQAYANKAVEAYNAQKQDEVFKYVEKAAAADPFKPEYKLDYANLIVRNDNRTQQDINEAEAAVNRAMMLGKYDVKLLANIASYYFSTGRIEEALELIDRTTEIRPLRQEEWQQKGGAYFSAVMSYFGQKDNENGLKYIDKGLAMIDEAKGVNTENLVPFIFNEATMNTLEKMRYIKDMHEERKSINIDKITFYSIFDMDIDSNHVPDQLRTSGEGQVSFTVESGSMTVENTRAVELPYIESRILMLEPNSEYVVQVKLENKVEVEAIPYLITNLHGQMENLVLNGDIYTAEFKVPEGFVAQGSLLRLYIQNKYVIQSIEVVKK